MQKRKAVKTTEGNKVKRLRLLKTFQAAWHDPSSFGHNLNPTPAHRVLCDEREG
jgi:hypothetical protein